MLMSHSTLVAGLRSEGDGHQRMSPQPSLQPTYTGFFSTQHQQSSKTHSHTTYSCPHQMPDRELCPPKAQGSFAIRSGNAEMPSPTQRASLCPHRWLRRDGGHRDSTTGPQADMLSCSSYCRSQRELPGSTYSLLL